MDSNDGRAYHDFDAQKVILCGGGFYRLPLMRLEEVGAIEWDRFLATTEACSPFHESRWLDIVAKHSGLHLHRLVFERKSHVVAGMPVFTNGRGFLQRVWSPPGGFGIPFMGPVFATFEKLAEAKRRLIMRDFVEALLRRFCRRPFTVMKIDAGPWVTDLRPFLDWGLRVLPRYTYTVDLAGGETSIWARMDSRLRTNLRSALLEYRAREAEAEDIDWMVGKVRERYRQQGRVLRIKQEYVKELLSHLPPERVSFLIVERERVRVTGYVCISYRDAVYTWFGSPTSGSEYRLANEVLLYHIFHRATEAGRRRVDLVGANTRGIAFFKAKFNPALDPYASVRRLPWSSHRAFPLARASRRIG